MRKTESKYCPKVITILGKKRIAFDLEEVVVETELGETETFYRYYEAVVPRAASRDEIITAIIRTQYSLNEELSMVNNVGVENPEAEHLQEYATFQEFRCEAKQLADIAVMSRADLADKTVAELDDIAQGIDIAVRTDGYYGLLKQDKIELLNNQIWEV
jgi:hypothetical protein